MLTTGSKAFVGTPFQHRIGLHGPLGRAHLSNRQGLRSWGGGLRGTLRVNGGSEYVMDLTSA